MTYHTDPFHSSRICGRLFLFFLAGTALGAAAAKWQLGISFQLLEIPEQVPLQAPKLLSACLLCLRFPLFLFCCIFMRHGKQLIPLAFAGRGFLLGFCTTQLVMENGIQGYKMACALLLCHGLLLLPLLYLLGLVGMGKTRCKSGEALAGLGLLILGSAGLCAVLHTKLTPLLLRLAGSIL